ncbi:MAG: chromosome segregation protein SMC [Acidobacteriota bacterium]|nr:chromosome segregation protein SMC [Acidobacteriota bacterium]
MLKLKQIQIQGFKSFADKTELTFDGSGIAAIVGPNGCGKSNISDAIAWVLGEQSARTLRGGRMRDVIFNGTRSRLPLGLAEVSVVLFDPERAEEPASTASSASTTALAGNGPTVGQDGAPGKGEAMNEGSGRTIPFEARPASTSKKRRRQSRKPAKPGELVVSRRLFRSGESEYLLNGRKVRLRDVQETFLGTGLGPDSYALIEQDRVGLILSSKPSDRRAIIEEAAGVTKFKVKRKLASSKLEQAKQNLLRVNDITEEVSRQLDTLKRQAGKAHRFRELSQEARNLSRSLFSARARHLKAQLSQVSEEFDRFQDQVDRKQEYIQQQETHFRRENDAHFEAETALKGQRERLSLLQMDNQRDQQTIQHQKDRYDQLEVRSRENALELQLLSEQEEQFHAQVGEKQQALQQVTRQFDSLDEQYDARNREQELRQKKLGELETAGDRLRSEQLDLLSRATTLRSAVTQMDEHEKQLGLQSVRLENERNQAARDHRSLADTREKAGNRHADEEARLRELADRVKALSADVDREREQQIRARQQVAEKREDLSAQDQRLQSLQELAAHHAYSAESVRMLLSVADRSGGADFRTHGILADLVEVNAEHEKTVEQFVRHELEYFLVDSPSNAREGIDLLRKSGAGRSTFLFPGNGASDLAPDTLEALVQDLADGDPRLIPMSRVIRVPSRHRQGLRSALPHLFHSLIAPSYEAALEIAHAHPKLTVLTPQGEVFRGQLISGGSGDQRGHLSLKREIRELGRRLESARRDLLSLEERFQALDRSVQSGEQELTRVNRQVQELEKELVGSDHRLEYLAGELERLSQREREFAGELRSVAQERSEIGRRRLQSGSEIARAEARKTEVGRAIDSNQADWRSLRDEWLQHSRQLSQTGSELAACGERKLATEADLERVQANLQACLQRRTRLDAQREEWSGQSLEIRNSVRQLEETVFNRAVQRASLEAEIRIREGRLEASRKAQAQLGEELQGWRLELDELRNRKTQIEVDRARLTSDYSHLEETCRQELGELLESLQVEGAGEFNQETYRKAEERYLRLRKRLDSMGPVNMMALEEFQECEERFDFLNRQRRDLLDSIEDTGAAIREIDEVSCEQFQQAFDAVNLNFRESFRELFGGGRGEMKLLDPQDLLETGIEIVAQPPGKRLQNVLLLSGGEKALTAIALLLAIFSYQPSPFCVLDEVDAPLDDVNLGRYSQKIKSMSGETQFLLITHSKRTMEAADALYGVTMEEAGVSKLVSVRMN